jgi:RNA polymerase sigma-B factor
MADDLLRDDQALDDLALFEEFHRTGRRRLRNELVERHIGLAIHIAKRFQHNSRDDVEQVAMMALVKAVDRFDPTLGFAFSSFAGRTIEGEIKRHFRDATWAVKVPRSAQELHLAVRRSRDELSAKLGRSPSVAEVADHLGVDRDDVLTGLVAAEARSVGTLDPPGSGDGERTADTQAVLGVTDSGFDHLDNELMVERALQGLAERERDIVRMHFYEGLSQAEIAERIGMSQMHVSRLLRRAIDTMRSQLADA